MITKEYTYYWVKKCGSPWEPARKLSYIHSDDHITTSDKFESMNGQIWLESEMDIIGEIIIPPIEMSCQPFTSGPFIVRNKKIEFELET